MHKKENKSKAHTMPQCHSDAVHVMNKSQLRINADFSSILVIRKY